MQCIKDQITKVLEETTGIKDPEVDFASNSDFGDYSSNVAMRMGAKIKNGNFLQNIEWIIKNVKKNNWESKYNDHFGLPVGRLTKEIYKLIDAKNDLVYLKPRVYAKMKGWWNKFSGHSELNIEYWLLPLTISSPLDIFEDPEDKSRFFLTFDYKHLGILVVEVDEYKNGNQIVTMFLVNKNRLKLKKSLLGKRRISSLLAPRVNEVAGAGLSGLQESKLFYSKLEKESQAFSLKYEIKQSPKELAEEIKIKLSTDNSLQSIVEKIDIAGPGFINFWLKKDILIDNLIQISKQKDNFGKSDVLKGKKIMFEYAHPNTHKAFHIGHLRNITTGETLSRLHEAIGAKIVRANYQGDVGLHIAKAIYGIEIIGFEDPKDIKKRAEYLGKVYAKGATAYEENEKAKERVGEINLKIYDKTDSKINKIYEKTRKWSLDYFAEIYKRVYTKFDRLYFESECAENGKKTALEALKNGILEESEGAIIFRGSKYGLHDRVFVSGKGVPTYEGKDLGLAKLQFKEFDLDLLVHTVGPEQTEYFKVIFKALEFILPETKGREFHVPYGWVKLKEGKMSSRTGNVILGEDILDLAKEKILKSYKIDSETSEKVAVGAVKYSFLKTGLAQEIAFDLKESISLEGNSGPYIQYTYARTQSVLAKAENYKGLTLKADLYKGQTLTEVESEILRKLSQFPEVILIAAKNYSPNILCNYLYDLASKFNTFYNMHRIIADSEQSTEYGENKTHGSQFTVHSSQTSEFRLLLTSATGQVIKNGLNLLGISSPERM